ncbi:olfactory receptor 2T27-like [Chaetodon auriga]|uniref:olfactory receptor 2T27-like n=1 Tax=Chaetodon auriga TaxID=39042 RepID=UPI004032DBA5
MNEELNLSSITLSGYVEVERFRYVYFVVIFMLYILIICCNSTIICLIVIHKNLHEPMYIFIAALLINSVLYSMTIYPKLLVDFLSDKQAIFYSVCLFQFFLFYSLGGSEFLLLSAMAYDRYVSICKPLQYPNIMKKTTVSIFLLLSWLVPACLVAGAAAWSANRKVCHFTLKGIFCNNSIYKLHCVTSRALSMYGIFILLNIVFFPMLYIVFTYTKILIICYRSSRDVRRKAAQTCLPHLLVLISFSLLCSYDIIILRLESDVPKTVRLIMTLQVILYHPLFNPIIYGLKMKEISEHLRKLFC